MPRLMCASVQNNMKKILLAFLLIPSICFGQVRLLGVPGVYFDANGNMGIGTALPSTLLDVVGDNSQSNSYITRKSLGQSQVTTSNSTQTTAFSIPVPQNKNMIVKIKLLAYQSDYSKSNSGEILGVFVRGTGNVSRDGTLIKNTSGALSGAGIDMTANTSTQAIDVKISGTSATVIWNFQIDLIYNT